jgi:hypothetical protein
VIEGAEFLQYVDDSGVYRRVSRTAMGPKPGGALTRAVRYDDGQAANRRVTYAGVTNHYRWSNG